VSITHCDTVACAVAFPDEHPMAIDVEQVDAHRAAVMERELATREIQALEAAGCGAILARAVGWTAKEALSKVLRCGLTCPSSLLTTRSVTAGEGRVFGEFENFAQYRFESWIRPGLVLTLVLPRRTRLIV
jgi:4'-phosphopantetheinyl transferase